MKKNKEYDETFQKDCNAEDEVYLTNLVQKRVTASGVILDVTTSTETLLTEKNKLTNMIKVIDAEMESRERAKSVLVWQKTVQEIEATELSSANDYTSVVSSAQHSSSSSSLLFSRPRARGLEVPASTSAEVSEEGTPRA